MNVALKIALIESGKRQFDLSRFLGVDPAKVSKIVHGWIQPDEETKEAIPRYLGEPINKLFPESETEGPHAEA